MHSPQNVSCNDGDLCTSGDRCNAGSCAGVPVVCSDGNYCDGAETCNEATGACEQGTTLPCSPGGRSPLRTCTAEWYVDDPNNLGGALAKKHICRQGDSTCDHDSSETTCTFRVAVCLRVPDPRFVPACSLANVASYELPRSFLKRSASTASALMAAMDSMPGARVGGMAVSVVGILGLKALTLYALARAFHFAHGAALRLAAMLSQAGEFGFVLFGAASAAGVIDHGEFNLAMLGIGVSMALTPLLVNGADALVGTRARRSEA